MIEVSTCVICDGPIRRQKRALVAPFLARRIWNKKPFCVDLVQCSQCGFTFDKRCGALVSSKIQLQPSLAGVLRRFRPMQVVSQ